jgi:type I restriction enzyme, S subunit
MHAWKMRRQRSPIGLPLLLRSFFYWRRLVLFGILCSHRRLEILDRQLQLLRVKTFGLAAEFEKWGLKHGDLMVTRTGATIGKCAVYDQTLGPALPSAYLIRVRLQLGLIDPTFAVLFLLSPLGQQQLLDGRTAVAQPNINAPAIVSLKLPVPNLELQKQIVRLVETAFSWIDRLATEATSARKLIDHLDQAVLAKAFRGELVPQDPNDEPASVLLGRIRSEPKVVRLPTKAPKTKTKKMRRKKR